MKKSSLLGVVCACISFLSISTASAGVVGLKGLGEGTFSFSLLDPTGAYVGGSSDEYWAFDFDSGYAYIENTQPFYGSIWTVHDVTFVDNLDGTYTGDMLFDWGGTYNIPVTIDWDINLSQVTTLDGGDGILGNPMTSGPFPGWNVVLDGTLAGQYVVPIPAAAWLFGSGLLGLVGMARRKKAA